MYGTDDLLTDFEQCPRKVFWSQLWKTQKLTATEFLQIGVRAGLIETIREDWGEVSGEKLYSMGSRYDLVTNSPSVYDQIVHLACISDIATIAIRKSSPWKIAEAVELESGHLWSSNIYIDPSGNHLRRIVFVSQWDDNRHYHFSRSWGSIGNVCAYNLPLEMCVVILGAHRDGKFHSPWAKAVMHPKNKQLRFRKKHNINDGFKESWTQIWREDFDHISTKSWLLSMLNDGVLQDSLVLVKIPIPESRPRQRILDLASRKLDIIESIRSLPDQNLSTCDWPTPCILRGPCHGNSEPSPRWGFVPVEKLQQS